MAPTPAVGPIFTPVLAVTIPIESSLVTSSLVRVPLNPRLPFTVRFGTGFVIAVEVIIPVCVNP